MGRLNETWKLKVTIRKTDIINDAMLPPDIGKGTLKSGV